MKKVVLSMIVAGTAIVSSVGLFFVGCDSTPPPVGAGGTKGGSVGAGGVVINTSPTGQGGSGGSLSTGLAPNGDANCGTQTSGTSQEPADVLLVLDRSGSMNESIAEDCCCNNTCASAVNATLTSTPGIRWGLKLFSSPNSSGRNSSCNVNTGVEVPISATAATTIQTQIAGVTPANNTPTAAAITEATKYLKTVTDPNNKVILLATDGEPNCKANGGSSDSDVPGTVTAIAAALTAGFKVYVVGIGPSVGNLDNFAQAGGTDKYFPATSPQDLASALAAISKAVATCTFALEKTPPDVNNIAVYLDKNLVTKDAANGWSFGANSLTIVLNGTTCDKIMSGAASTVQVLFGCAGIAPPPILF